MTKKAQQVIRKLFVAGPDIAFNISSAVAIQADIPSVIAFERRADDTLRLTWNAKIIPDFAKVKYLEIMREEDVKAQEELTTKEIELAKRAQRLLVEEAPPECAANSLGKHNFTAALDEIERLRELLKFHLVSNNDGE